MDGGAQQQLTREQLETLRQLKRNFEFFAPRILKVKSKDPLAAAPVLPLILNRAQSYIHARIEQQKRETGKVRVLILKGRQMGVSTYVQARFYHQVSLYPGRLAFILTHEQDATDTLFDMADRFYQNSPPWIRFPLAAASAKEMVFEGRESGYAVATAGGKAVGRSKTAHLFHGSEVAFWPNALAHMRGVFQIVPNSPGTEIILETTAEGLDPVFFPLWQKAEAGESEYLAIFTPWFWDDGYRLRPPPDWRPSTDDAEYQALHHIDLDQLYWRRRKIDDDFLGDDKAFQREYPATSTEAFVAFTDSYIPAEKVLRARKTTGLEAVGPRIVGVDPARYGDDASGWIDRVGRVVREATRYHDLSTMQLANLIMRRIDQAKEAGDPIHALFIDTVGLGVGVYDRCVEAGYGHVVHEVIAGERSIDPEHFVDKKAEIWADMKAWFERGAQIPDSDTLQMDILTPKYDYEGKQRLRIESKDKIRARGLRSPDLADALALTFAEPVFPTNKDDDVKRERRRDKTRRPGWRVN